MFDFFISHSSADKGTIVDELIVTLENMGYSIWYDKNEILAGDNIANEVKKGLSNSYCLLLVLTSNFVQSRWTFFETGIFDSINHRRIIPLIFEIDKDDRNNVQGILGNLKYLDAEQLSKEEIASELARTLSRTKQENNEIQVVDKLIHLQRQLATYETVNSAFLSIFLKEYLDLLENHKDYLIMSAKKIVRTLSQDLLETAGLARNYNNDTNRELLSLLDNYDIGSINVREFIHYVLLLDGESNADDHIVVLNRALVSILTYYVHTKYPIKPAFSQIEVAYPDELTYKDFVDMFEIDQKVMRADLIADVETAYSWYKYNRYTHIVVRDVASQKTVGYFSVLPVTDEIYTKIISGDFQDKDFTEDAIEQYIFPNFYRLYIAAVGIDPLYQNTGAFIKLYNALIDMFISLAKDREIFVSEVLAEASTKQGEKFCKMVGMKKVTSTPNATDIYKVVTIPPEFRLNNRKGKELYGLYRKKFEEYKDFFEQ